MNHETALHPQGGFFMSGRDETFGPTDRKSAQRALFLFPGRLKEKRQPDETGAWESITKETAGKGAPGPLHLRKSSIHPYIPEKI